MPRARPLSVILLAACLVILSQPAGAGPGRTFADTNWRQYQFDAGHSGNNALESVIGTDNVSTLAPAYADEVGDFVSLYGYPVLAVAEGKLYVAANSGLFVYEAAGCGLSSCQPLWTAALPEQVYGPAVASGFVFMVSAGTDNRLYAFDANGGVNMLSVFDENGCGARLCQPLWIGKQPGNGYVAGSPSVVNGIVYVGYGDGMYAFDAAGCGGSVCDPLWKGSIVSASATAVANGAVFTQSGAGGHLYAAGVGGLYAFDAAGCGASLCPSLWHQHGIGGPAIVVNGAVYSPSGLKVKVLQLP